MIRQQSSVALCLFFTWTILSPLLLPAQHHDKTEEAIEVRIDPSSALTGKSARDCFVSVRYIPLETSKLTAFNEVTQMEVTNKYYVIWDKQSNAILFFDRSGAFVRKITNTDKALPVPYKKIDHFTVNERKGELMFNDGHSPYVYYYDLDGGFKKMEEKPSHLGISFISHGGCNAYFAGYDRSYSTDLRKPAYNLLIEDRDKEISFHLPFDAASIDYIDMYAVDQAFYNNRGKVYFSAPYDYHIYAIDSAGHTWTAFNFVMPALNTVPNDFLSNIAYKGKRQQYTTSHEEVIYAVTDFYRSGDALVFRLFGHSTNKIFSYNVKNGVLRSLSDISADQSTYMLPVLGKRIFAMDQDNRMISALPAGSLFETAKVDDEEWMNTLPPPLKRFFNDHNQQNPVLAIIQLR